MGLTMPCSHRLTHSSPPQSVAITGLQYRLARRDGPHFLACGDRYPTKEAARTAAPAVNRAREFAGLEKVDHILTLPSAGSDGADPSHFLQVEPL